MEGGLPRSVSVFLFRPGLTQKQGELLYKPGRLLTILQSCLRFVYGCQVLYSQQNETWTGAHVIDTGTEEGGFPRPVSVFLIAS